ncbi:MAG: biopolymer transporter ExbD [Chlamydiota bacterium]|jgi:biopolymer transport protein ExbD
MSLIPDEELKPNVGINFAAMIDFLFLMLALFSTLAVTRATLYDSAIDLAQLNSKQGNNLALNEQDFHRVNLSIDHKGDYHWVTEFNEHLMQTTAQVQEELTKQYQTGLLPKNKQQTLVLLHIDRSAPWDSIAKLIFSIKEVGFDVHPIYESENSQ